MGLKLRRYEVHLEGLDEAHDGLTIAHLTDLHVGMLTPHRKIRRALEMAEAEKPSLLVMTGDFVCYNKKFVGALGEICSGLSTPAYAVLGNHDYWTDAQGVKQSLEKAGVSGLTNQHTEISLNHAPFTIVGIDDAITEHADPKKSFAGVRKHGSRLVLTHAPNLADRADAEGPSLVLAGHTHGGHVHIPKLTSALFRRVTGARYLKGWYEVGRSKLYVNCGVGSSSVPIRAGAPAEVAILTLRRA